jgi:hypothetical protein
MKFERVGGDRPAAAEVAEPPGLAVRPHQRVAFGELLVIAERHAQRFGLDKRRPSKASDGAVQVSQDVGGEVGRLRRRKEGAGLEITPPAKRYGQI